MLCNGGFEDGLTCREHDGPVTVVPNPKHSGSYAVRLGNRDYACEGYKPGAAPEAEVARVYQTMRIPSGGQSALRFWYRVVSQDTIRVDFLRVLLRNEGGNDLEEILRVGSLTYGCGKPPWDSGWQQASFSLDGYQGQQVQLCFENHLTNKDAWFNTWSYVDDVQVVPVSGQQSATYSRRDEERGTGGQGWGTEDW